MTPEDAKLLLQMRRPGDRDAGDPMFAEALLVVERDPALKTWLEREAARDHGLTQKLAMITPPPGLREAILAGARVSEPKHVARWRQPRWLAVAAAVVLLLGATLTLRFGGNASSLEKLALAAAEDLSRDGRDHAGLMARLQGVQARLAERGQPLSEQLGRVIDLEQLRRDGCRTVRIAGRDMFELCFQNGGAWFHVYVMPRRGAAGMSDVQEIAAAGGGRIAAVAWSDEKYSYALVSDAGKYAMMRLL